MATSVACASAPEPAQPEPIFTSEAEAFAAAEETYRAYVDALNAHRLDPTGAADPQLFLVGSALESDIGTQRMFDDAGIRLVGSTIVVSVTPSEFSRRDQKVTISVCVDSSDTRVLDTFDIDVTPADRPTLSRLTATMTAVEDHLLISGSNAQGLGEC